MINLETYERTTKENFLDGQPINFIKKDNTNKCVTIA